MTAVTELRLPTVTVPVRLALFGREVAPAEVFLRDVPRRGKGHVIDDVAELLDGPEAFVPVRLGGQVRLCGKHAIEWVSLARPDDDPADLLALYDRQHRVELELAGGTRLSGTLLDSSPADRPRVIDHLNHARTFVRLWTSDDHYLIHKARIVGVTELPGEA